MSDDRSALEDCVGALQCVLAFYEPGQRYLDTEAWKRAHFSAVRAYLRGATELGWTIRPMESSHGETHFIDRKTA